MSVPKLRFGEFCETWQKYRLGDVTKVYDGTHQTPKYVEKGIPFYSVEHVTANQFDKTKFISKQVFEKENKRVMLEKEDILMTRIGSIGVAKFIDWDVNASFYVSLALIKANKEYNSLFFSHLIHSEGYQRELWKKTIHVAFPKKINLGELANTFYYSPPSLTEQQKISSFLSSVDEKIQQLTKKKSLLEDYKKGVMQKIFSQELRFKDQNGNDYTDWEEKKLGDISKVYQPKTISQTDLTEEGFVVYGANGIIGRYHSYNHEFQQIAVTCRGNTCGTVNLTKKLSWITGNAMVINLDNSNDCDKKFMYFQLSNTNLRYLITGSGQPQITGDIKSHKIKKPVLEEQQKIANFLSAIDEKITLTNIQIDNTKAFKKGLLQQMFV